MRSSGFHGVCKIKVIMAAFWQRYAPLSNCKRKQSECFIVGLHKT